MQRISRPVWPERYPVNNPRPIPDEELHAYIDGELDPERAMTVRNALAQDTALAERVALFQADKAMLKSVYGPLEKLPLPAGWVSRMHRRPPIWQMTGAIAAAILILFGSVAWLHYTARSGDAIEEALNVRAGIATGQRQVVTVQGDQGRRYDSMLAQAVALHVRVPDLAQMGYRLSRLELYGNAAELLYRGPQDQVFTLYIRRSDGSTRFDQFERKGLRVCIWQDDQISAVMAGDIPTAAMQRLVALSYTGLTT